MALPVIQHVVLTPGVWTPVTPPVTARWLDVLIINESADTISVRSNSADSTTQIDIVSGGERKLRLLAGDYWTEFVIRPDAGVGPAKLLWSIER